MARQRFIWPTIWTDPTVGRLPPQAMLLFIGCFSNADDSGRLLGDPAYLKSVVFPYQRITVAEVQKLRDRVLRDVPTLVLYVVNDVEYLVFHRWIDYQKPKYPTPSKLPAPPGTSRRKAASLRQKRSGNDSGKSSGRSSGNRSGNRSPETAQQSGLGQEVPDSSSTSDRSALRHAPNLNGLTPIDKLLDWANRDIDDHGRTIKAAARGLPEAATAKVWEAVQGKRPKNRAAYIVTALQAEREEHESVRVAARASLGEPDPRYSDEPDTG